MEIWGGSTKKFKLLRSGFQNFLLELADKFVKIFTRSPLLDNNCTNPKFPLQMFTQFG